MTNEEAIKIIEFVLGRGELAERYGLNDSGISVYPHLSEEREALNMAIDALRRGG